MNYFEMPGYSQSQLNTFRKSPLQYLHEMRNRTETHAMGFGSAAHAYFLERDEFDKKYLLLGEKPEPTKDFRSTKNKAWRDEMEQQAIAENKTILSSDDYEKIITIHNNCSKIEQIKQLIFHKENKFETPGFWKHNGFNFKRKTDIQNDLFICDLKFTNDAHPHAFKQSFWKYGYDLQSAMYVHGDMIEYGNFIAKDFYYIAIETNAPFDISIHTVTPEIVERGIGIYLKLAEKLAECEQNNSFPGYYENGINTIGL